MEIKNFEKNHLNNQVTLSLKLGIALSLTLVVIGLIIIGIVGTKDIGPVVPLNQLPQGILKLDPTSIITLGILVLLVTAALQVVIALVTFAIDRNKLYLGISIALLCILTFSLVLALI